MSRIKAILFDLDGVLVDARDWHFIAFNEALRPFGLQIGREEHEDRFDGLPTRLKLATLADEGRLPSDVHPLVLRAKQVATRRLILDRCRPDPEKKEMLRGLKNRGLRLGVCSNSSRESLRLMLEGAGLVPYFGCALSADDVARPKPAPDIYLEAMTRLRVEPGETVIVEDGAYGVESARRAGGRVLKVGSIAEVGLARVRDFIESAERGIVRP